MFASLSRKHASIGDAMYTSKVEIYNRNGWTLTSYGRGAAYTLQHDLPQGKTESCFFQGDDAEFFRAEVIGQDGFIIDGMVCGMPRVECAFQEYLSVMEPDNAQG
jgi:hypothetical protein